LFLIEFVWNNLTVVYVRLVYDTVFLCNNLRSRQVYDFWICTGFKSHV